MKKLGILAGIGPASTIEYYKLIIKLYQEKVKTADYPEMVLHSINMTKMLEQVTLGNLDELTDFLKIRIQVLEDAGAEFAILASNTPHIVFDQLAKSVNIPMISIVAETCRSISEVGIRKIGLLGTKSTMSKGFYQNIGLGHNLNIVTPDEATQNYVHEKYMGELIFNKIVPETKKRLIAIIEDLRYKEGIEGIILGGTELPLILNKKDFEDFNVFDTTQIHVASIIKKMTEV